MRPGSMYYPLLGHECIKDPRVRVYTCGENFFKLSKQTLSASADSVLTTDFMCQDLPDSHPSADRSALDAMPTSSGDASNQTEHIAYCMRFREAIQKQKNACGYHSNHTTAYCIKFYHQGTSPLPVPESYKNMHQISLRCKTMALVHVSMVHTQLFQECTVLVQSCCIHCTLPINCIRHSKMSQVHDAQNEHNSMHSKIKIKKFFQVAF